jgi:GTP cyclohydrolase I
MKKLDKANGSITRTDEEKLDMIDGAAKAYGDFLSALGFDWESDPHTKDTPFRVAKAFVGDLISGTNSPMGSTKTFPNDEGYTGLICQTNIPVVSMCAHHNLSFVGVAHVAYIPGKEKSDQVLGLSKLNRIVDWYSRRPNIQESLTKQIHDKVSELCVGNRGVAVVVEAKHNCVACRGIKHSGSAMKTSQLSGYFWTNEVGTRQEFFNLISQDRF